MQYIRRDLERKFLLMSRTFKAVMVTGARQVGKSTMLKHLAKDQKRTYVTMDDARIRNIAQRDPKLFFQMYRTPILIDEVQKAPALFEQIKIMCDESDERGSFWLTGSQSRKLLKNAGDSLAGRLCVLHLYSLSQSEILNIHPEEEPDYTFEGWTRRNRMYPENNILKTFEHIWKGGMPDAQILNPEQIQEFFNSYIETYLLRDAVDDNGISNTDGFRKFLRACAAFSGQLLNYNDLASAAGISGATAKEWIRILQCMGIIVLLEPYYSNELKRLVKKPKLYFCDTGLCAYLSSWTTRDVLMNGAAAGHYYENYVVGEFIRRYAYGKERVNLNYYRDRNQKEIDLIVEENGILHPLEIKKSASPSPDSIRTFSLLQKSGKKLGNGGIVCMTDKPIPITAENYMIPSNII